MSADILERLEQVRDWLRVRPLSVGNIDTAIVRLAEAAAEIVRLRGEVESMASVLGEAYQVVGCLLSDTNQFDTPHGEKILDNLSQMRMAHDDVLPWASIEAPESADNGAVGYQRIFNAISAATRSWPVAGEPTEISVRTFLAALGAHAIYTIAPAEAKGVCSCPEHGSWIAADDILRNVRELDVALNGEEGAAQQAMLCDIVAQVKRHARLHGPVFDTPQPADGGAVMRSRSGAVAFLFDFIAEYDEHEESEWSPSWRALAERARELCEKRAAEIAGKEAAYLAELGEDPRLDGWAPDTHPPAAQVQECHMRGRCECIGACKYGLGGNGAALECPACRLEAALQHRGDSRGGEG